MTGRSYSERDASVAVRCPECGAEPTYPCVDGEAATAPVHDERMDDLNLLIRKGVAAYESEGMNP